MVLKSRQENSCSGHPTLLHLVLLLPHPTPCGQVPYGSRRMMDMPPQPSRILVTKDPKFLVQTASSLLGKAGAVFHSHSGVADLYVPNLWSVDGHPCMPQFPPCAGWGPG